MYTEDNTNDILRQEHEKIEKLWVDAKKMVEDLIEPKYIVFVEENESYYSKGIVEIYEIPERKSGYSNFPHCKIKGEKLSNVYINFTTELETYDENCEYEGEKINYWVWQTVGHLGDDYSGYLLLPLSDGRYWKVGYSC